MQAANLCYTDLPTTATTSHTCHSRPHDTRLIPFDCPGRDLSNGGTYIGVPGVLAVMQAAQIWRVCTTCTSTSTMPPIFEARLREYLHSKGLSQGYRLMHSFFWLRLFLVVILAVQPGRVHYLHPSTFTTRPIFKVRLHGLHHRNQAVEAIFRVLFFLW
jgi:hypothetical protein